MSFRIGLRRAAVGTACLASAVSLAAGVAPGAASASAPAASSVPASSAAGWKYLWSVSSAAKNWVCMGVVDQRWKVRGKVYARARMWAPSWGVSCHGWLEVHKGRKGKWKRVSSIYAFGPNHSRTTGWHRDFVGYYARVCVMDDVFVKKCSRGA
jgi:hypothetical protein